MTRGKREQRSQRKAPGYMRLADLAQLLDVTHAHLANLVRRGGPPDTRRERSGGSVSHWICANRNSKTATRLSARPFHRRWSEPTPDLDLLATSIPALRYSCQFGGARIINSPNLPSHCVFGSGEARGNRISSKGATPMLDKKGRL